MDPDSLEILDPDSDAINPEPHKDSADIFYCILCLDAPIRYIPVVGKVPYRYYSTDLSPVLLSVYEGIG